MNLRSINFKVGSVNPSGLSSDIFYIQKEGLAQWPNSRPQDDLEKINNLDSYVNMIGNFQVVKGFVWNYLYSTQGKGKISCETTGETDCKMMVNKATLFFPKITTEIRAFAKRAANGDFVFLIKHDGMYFVLGDPDYRTIVTCNIESGDAPGSAKGCTIEIECPCVTPLPVYNGMLIMANNIVKNLSDGSVGEISSEDRNSLIFDDGSNLTVTYNGNGADSGYAPVDSNSPYASGDTVTVLGNVASLTKEGKTFMGWNTAADGTGTSYTAAATFTISADVVLYANWKKDE